MEAKFLFDVHLLRRAQRLDRRKHWFRFVTFYGLFTLLPVLGGISLIFAAWVVSKQLQTASGICHMLWPFWLYTGLLLALRWFVDRRALRTSLPAGLSAAEYTVSVNQHAVLATVVGRVSSTLEWTSICRWVADEGMLLLYMNRSRFIPIPRTSLSEQEWTELLDVVNSKVPKEARC